MLRQTDTFYSKPPQCASCQNSKKCYDKHKPNDRQRSFGRSFEPARHTEGQSISAHGHIVPARSWVADIALSRSILFVQICALKRRILISRGFPHKNIVQTSEKFVHSQAGGSRGYRKVRRQLHRGLSLTDEEVHALRQITGYIRARLSRAAIADGADVQPVDLDNFVSVRTSEAGADHAVRFKSQRPSQVFQLRMLKYIAKNVEIRRDLSISDSLVHVYYKTLLKRIDSALLMPDHDLMYESLAEVGLSDESGCKGICAELAGNYFLYQLPNQENSSRSKISTSFIRVGKFNRYKKMPAFEKFDKVESDNVSFCCGTIFQLQGHCLFVGFRTNKTEWVGADFIAIERGYLSKRNSFDGIISSFNPLKGYEFGRCRFVRTNSAFNPKMIGHFAEHSMANLAELGLAIPVDEKSAVKLIQSVFCPRGTGPKKGDR